MNRVALVFLLAFVSVSSENLLLGDWIYNKNMIYHTKAYYMAIPFIKRERDVFFNSPNQEKINRIEAKDEIKGSKATAIVTAGGIGQTYVNIRLTSERGNGLYYDIKIYS